MKVAEQIEILERIARDEQTNATARVTAIPLPLFVLSNFPEAGSESGVGALRRSRDGRLPHAGPS